MALITSRPWLVFQDSLGKLVPDCQNILDFTAKDDEGGVGANLNL